MSYRDPFDQADFSATAALVEPIGNIILIKKANKSIASVGDTVQYTLSMSTDNFPNGLSNVVIKDILPPGFRYIKNTAQLNNQTIPSENLSINGRNLNFKLGNMPASIQWNISYDLRIGPGTAYKKVENSATAYALGEQSFVAKASVEVKDELMNTIGFISGRVLQGCGKQSKPQANTVIYLETGQSTTTDDQGFWQLTGIIPGVHVVSLDQESLPKGISPLLCTNNTLINKQGNSQFVDLKQGGLAHVIFHVQGKVSTKAILKKKKDFNPLSYFNDDYANKAKKGFEILWPPKRFVPPIASISVVVKHDRQHKVSLIINGKAVSALNYQGSSNNNKENLRISRWRGIDIDINKRNNQLKVLLKDKAGNIISEKQQLIHFSGKAHQVEFLKEQSTLLADGQSTPILTFRITDNEGFSMRAKTHTYFNIEEGDYEIIEADESKSLDLNTYSYEGDHKLYIDHDGLARIRLRPTSQTGEIRIRIKLDNRQSKTISAWLVPHIRKEWLLVGIAESNTAYRKLKGNIQTLNDKDIHENFYHHGRLAFFAKGKVLGKYLLTIAYDSAKPITENINDQQNKIDPERWYTVYGTQSTNKNEAASSSKLFLKLEREQFYFLFGNYQTNLSVTELSNYKRSLQGIHTEYKGKNIHYNLSLSESSNKHQRDELAGDGTSGEYFLTHPIIPNSETITLETRDRFHSEKIVSSRQLTQHTDYEIDYDRHSIFFKFPITTHDANLHPNFIIVDYESEDSVQKYLTAAGRIGYTSDNNKAEIGVSLINEHDEQGQRQQLIGTDLHYRPDPETEFNVEYARSQTDKASNAWLLEAKKTSSTLSGRAYIRQQQNNFGLGHAAKSENASKKIGIDAKYHIDTNTSISGEIYQKEDLNSKAITKQASIIATKKMSQGNIHIGLRHSSEYTEDTENQGTLLTLGGHITPPNSPINFHATVEKNISGNDESINNPDRLILGAGYKINNHAQLFVEHEITKNKEDTIKTNRIGINTELWQGASLKTSINNGYTIGTYANLGLAQHVKLSDKLNADITVDQSKHLSQPQDASNNDFTAYSIGLSWRNKTWAWTGRIEHRNSDQSNKSNFQYSLLHKLGNSNDISAQVNLIQSSQANEEQIQQATVSIGSAWHPLNSQYNILQRLDYKYEDNLTPNEYSQKLINNIHLNKRLDAENQISFHHGIKYSIEKSNTEKPIIDTLQLKARHNINEHWDLGAHTGYLHDWNNDNWEYNYGISVGYSPANNIWLNAGYNFEGYYDNDFDDSAYTHQGPYIQFNYRLNRYDINKLFRRGQDILMKKPPHTLLAD